jgi:opacity protein-like surface antigen
MKKAFVLGLLVSALSFSATSYGREGGAYIGIGGSYAIEDFYTEKFEERAVPIAVSIDDTWGANVKLGYHVNEFFSVETVFEYFSSFETSEAIIYPTMPGAESAARFISEKGELDVMTFMLVGKFCWPGRAIEPYGIVGAGVMNVDWDRKLIAGSGSASDSSSVSSSATGGCARVGLGLDFFLSDHLSLGLEGATTSILGKPEFDLDPLGEVGEDLGITYWTITLGAAYHF